jgi:hypothetical protein
VGEGRVGGVIVLLVAARIGHPVARCAVIADAGAVMIKRPALPKRHGQCPLNRDRDGDND